MLQVSDLTVRYGPQTITDRIGFEVKQGQWLMIVGPNGAGKSTIIHAISGNVSYEGMVCFEGKNVRREKPQDLAKKIGVLTQNHYVGYAFTVEEVVRLGRYAYSKGMFASKSAEDDVRVEEALEMTGLSDLRKKSVLQLSGGELQRTFLAQCFAQDPRLLILDEPTNHLDLVYQQQVFELIADWMKQPGRAVLSVVHDLSLARAYGTEALLLEQGRIAAYGSASGVLTPEYLNPVYQMDVPGWMKRMLSQWQTE